MDGKRGPTAEVIGAHLEVPVLGGRRIPYANLDYAASAPALKEVWEAVRDFLPWYSSVHRGAGWKSRVATAAYESSREAIGRFVGARASDVTILTRNTTDAINLLARCMPERTLVITTSAEHHADLLPWRRLGAVELPVSGGPEQLIDSVEAALRRRPSGQPAVVATTGASNVTGEVYPLAELSRVAHRHGARILVDAAQLAPHRPIDIAALDLDWIAFSGHKLYAPFGCGALVGCADWLAAAPPYLAGGGAVSQVGEREVVWAGLPDRHEGGSPNVVGAVALGTACTALAGIGMDQVALEERRLAKVLEGALDRIPGLERYEMWPGSRDRVAVVTFNLPGRDHAEVASILSAEYGIGVRSGSFCAHPLLNHLAAAGNWSPGCGRQIPGAVRVSLGLGSQIENVERLSQALLDIAERGPREDYLRDAAGSVAPREDDRGDPRFDIRWPAAVLPQPTSADTDSTVASVAWTKSSPQA